MKKYMGKIYIIVICIMINLVGRFFATHFQMPFWLDMVGTCVATYFTGLWGGILAGIFNNMLAVFGEMPSLLYTITGVGAAVLLHIFIKKGYLNNAYRAAIASFWLGIFCVCVSTPINLIFYNGYSGNVWGDTLVDMLRWYDFSKVVSAYAGEIIVEIVDKQLCILLAYIIIKFTLKYKEKRIKDNRVVASLLIIFVLSGMFATPLSVKAEEKADDNFVSTIYDNRNGMVSSEANSICETDDGSIWIGSYAGLTRYDGTTFEFVRDSRLVNVVGMMKDSKGRLWIGTNDAGIAKYENGEYTFITKEDGLPTNSIRCFVEDKNGDIYVGTSGRICRISEKDKIEVLPYDISFAKYMAIYNDIIMVLDNSGCLYGIKDGNVFVTNKTQLKGDFFYSMAYTSKGMMAGTDKGELYVLDAGKEMIHLKRQVPFEAKEISAIYEDSKKRIWVATESEFGYFYGNDIFHPVNNTEFASSIDSFYEDYQGNIWVVSSNYGVMKLVENQFVNLFDVAEVKNTVTNAIILYDGAYYVGTDTGAVAINAETNEQIQNIVTKTVDGSRVRAFYIDSDEKLWVCTYGGLYVFDKADNVSVYDMQNSEVCSDRFRCATELSDKTMVVGTADGITYIKDGMVTGLITREDGLENTQILTLLRDEKDTVYAGSDGSGIYVISDGKIKRRFTVEDGLSSNVVLRMVPCKDGYIVVTSNCLCHLDEKGEIRRLSNFPYYNNYDVIVVGEEVYITCSAGLYRMKLEDLCINNVMQYSFYGANEGLLTGLTANSWNMLDKQTLYLCGNNGVIIFDNSEKEEEVSLKYGIDSIECNGKRMEIFEDEKFIIPPNTKTLTIYGSVKNYAFTEEKVRFFIKGMENEAKVYEWNKMEPIQIAKPVEVEYTICFQILDNTGEKVLQEAKYVIGNSVQPWQKPIYKLYLFLVLIEILCFALINVINMVLFANRKNQLEVMQVELEKTVREQTEELRFQQKKTKELFHKTVTALSEAVDAKDRYTSGHSKRVAEYSMKIAARLGKTKEEQEEIYRAGLLHDVGKIRIPREIINKAGKLTDEEYNTIKIHPITGYHILRGIDENDVIALGAKYHHERYDGKGYPNGLSGEKIPEVARIMGVADSYDAMTSNRSYRNALPQDVVKAEIEKGKGTQFDPKMADIMLKMIEEDPSYQMKQEDTLHRTILVVDDEPICTKIVKKIMSDEPMYQVVSADSGKAALEILSKQHFDLILLDVRMPEMDGMETLQHIKEKYNIPVAFMTSDRNDEALIRFSKYGIDEYITKPFQPLLIKEIVHNMTERTVMAKEE